MYLDWKKMTSEQREEATRIAEAVLAEVKPLVLGKSKPGLSCNCGAISHGEAVVTDVQRPGTFGYPTQDAGWATWNVCMTERGHSEYSYSCGVEAFVDEVTLADIFEKHWRPFFERYFMVDLEAREARNAPGGDLAWKPICIWF